MLKKLGASLTGRAGWTFKSLTFGVSFCLPFGVGLKDGYKSWSF
jgi:hypothetical protein